MKTLIQSISIFTLTVAFLVTVSIISHTNNQVAESITEPTQSIQSHTYTYTVTHSSNGEYYATSSDQTGLFFTESELSEPSEPVKVGDTITATFEGNEEDSPFTVSLSDEEGTMIMAEDGSYVPESFYK